MAPAHRTSTRGLPDGGDGNRVADRPHRKTLYHYRLVARNANGTSTGADTTFTTLSR